MMAHIVIHYILYNYHILSVTIQIRCTETDAHVGKHVNAKQRMIELLSIVSFWAVWGK